MKVIAIMGSPKGKGNGYKVVRMIEDRLKQAGEVDFEYLFLKDADLQLCKGCFTCVTRGEDYCPLKDGRAAIEKKLLEADGIILSSPVYVMNVSWLMKNFIDRFAYANHRLRFFKPKGLLVTNSGGSGLKEARKAMENALGGLEIVASVGVGTPPWPQVESAVRKKERQIDEAAMAFYRAMEAGSFKEPGFNMYLRFRIMKEVSVACKQWLPADYNFYQDKEYYYDTRIGAFKKTAVDVLLKVLFPLMKGMGPGDVKWPVIRNKEEESHEN